MKQVKMMNIDKMLGKFISTKKTNKKQNNFEKIKPLKEFKLASKPVQVFNNNPIPKKSIIKKTYKDIPDDVNIPLQFMTRKQYLNKYINNQEKVNGKKFSKQQKQKYIKDQMKEYKHITGRYTTETNKYYKPAVVIFNDKNNLKNIKGNKFANLAWHEYGHEYVEDNNIKMAPMQEELYADEFAKNKGIPGQRIRRDHSSKNMAYIRTMGDDEEVDDYIMRRFDLSSNQDPKTVRLYHGTTKKHLANIKKQGLQPPNKTNIKNFDIPKRHSGNVSLAENKSTALWYAQQNSSGEEPIIIAADVPFEDYEKGLFKFRKRQDDGDHLVSRTGGTSDEVLVDQVPKENIKLIIPASTHIQEKEFRTDPWIHGSLEKEREESLANEKFSALFNSEGDL